MTDTAPTRSRIVVGVDGSDHSKEALRWAARVAAAEDVRIDAVLAWEFPTYVSHGGLVDAHFQEEKMRKLLSETVDEVFGANRPIDMQLRTVRAPAAPVLLAAAENAVMVVVGSRGHGGFVGLLLGSVSAKVAEHATCPVLVVHAPRDEAEQPS